MRGSSYPEEIIKPRFIVTWYYTQNCQKNGFCKGSEKNIWYGLPHIYSPWFEKFIDEIYIRVWDGLRSDSGVSIEMVHEIH